MVAFDVPSRAAASVYDKRKVYSCPPLQYVTTLHAMHRRVYLGQGRMQSHLGYMSPFDRAARAGRLTGERSGTLGFVTEHLCVTGS